jgi:predicted MPP superfamily phosphohydrolase
VISRRRFLQLTSLGTLGTGLYSWRVEPHHVEFVRRPLPIRLLPSRLHGRTLVHVSDIHVGPRVDDDYLIETFQRVSALKPDVVVVTGDFVSYHDDIYDHAARVYHHFPKARLGTLAILGNHDYGPAWAHPEIALRIVEVVESAGITVLRNRIADVEGLQIAGLDDLWAHAFQPTPVLKAIDSRKASLVLSHNPDTVDLPGWESYEGWILSGHTHGGQCKPPFLPPPILPVQNKRYTAGEFELSGNRRMYISRGIGHLIQFRFNVRPEVTVFELTTA